MEIFDITLPVSMIGATGLVGYWSTVLTGPALNVIPPSSTESFLNSLILYTYLYTDKHI
jgi:hypothetical protein